MQTASIQTRMPKELKEKVEILLKQMGLDISTAIRAFFAKIAETKKIPFEIGIQTYNGDPEEDKRFWNAIMDESLKDVWGRPEDDIWDEILPKLPLIRKP